MNYATIPSSLSAMARICKTSASVALCTAALLLPGMATAADWEIEPVRIALSQSQQTAAITLKNTSSQPTSIQVQVVAWTQVDGKDVYESSRELLVSPPIVTIAPNSEQIIRAALRRPADPDLELSYRINLQELPPAPVAGFMGVNVAMRVGLPVFVEPLKGKTAPKMQWRVQQMPNTQLKVSLQNQGKSHVQVTDFSLYLPGGNQAVAGEAASTYIMPGQSHEWLLSIAANTKVPGGRLQLRAFTDAGDVDTQLALGRP
jgi:fimbrial chaperone protein